MNITQSPQFSGNWTSLGFSATDLTALHSIIFDNPKTQEAIKNKMISKIAVSFEWNGRCTGERILFF